jgi:hypothetical protein
MRGGVVHLGRPTAADHAPKMLHQPFRPCAVPFGGIEPLPWPGPPPIDGGQPRRPPDRTFGSGRMWSGTAGTPPRRSDWHSGHAFLLAQTLDGSAVDQRTANPLPGVERHDAVAGQGIGISQDLEPDPIEDPVGAVPITERDDDLGR